MLSDNRIESIYELFCFILEHYDSQKRSISFLSSGLVGRGLSPEDHNYASFLIDKKTAIKYSIPAFIESSAGLWLGVGPEFVPLEHFLAEKNILSGEATKEAIVHNLKILDEYLAGRLI